MSSILFNLTNTLWSIALRFMRESRQLGLVRLFITLIILGGLAFLGGWLFTPAEQFPRIMFTLPGLRFWIFPVLAFWLALNLAGLYIRDLYELPSTRLGVKYISSVLYVTGLPILEVIDGKLKETPNQVNLLKEVGGPGILNVAPGSLVLLERMDGPSNVYASGYHLVSRGETVKMTASLEDQHGFIAETTATTKDGIEVTVREIRFHYRMRASRRNGEYLQRERANPFPFSSSALKNFTYNRTVTSLGLTPPAFYMNFTVDGVITEYIREHQFDSLTNPAFEDQDPREAIKKNFLKKSVQDRFRNIGMELLWVDIGHFDVTDKVWKQRVEGWGVRWVGTTHVELAAGEARRQAYREIGRVEGQAQLIIELAHQLNQIQAQAGQRGLDHSQELPRLILVYIAQTMDAMSDRPTETGRLPE